MLSMLIPTYNYDCTQLVRDLHGQAELSGARPSHLPVVGELRRMEVQSFRRCVEMWNEADSPVTGARYEAYLQLARATAKAC